VAFNLSSENCEAVSRNGDLTKKQVSQIIPGPEHEPFAKANNESLRAAPFCYARGKKKKNVRKHKRGKLGCQQRGWRTAQCNARSEF